MSLLDRWKQRRVERGHEQNLEYGTGLERYHIVLRVTGGSMYNPKTYFLTTEVNKEELSQPEINEIAYNLLRKQYGGSLFDAHVVSRYDRSSGIKWGEA